MPRAFQPPNTAAASGKQVRRSSPLTGNADTRRLLQFGEQALALGHHQCGVALQLVVVIKHHGRRDLLQHTHVERPAHLVDLVDPFPAPNR